MIVKLYDAFNYYRAIAEKDPTSLAPRKLYQDMVAQAGTLHVWVYDGKGARKRRQAIFPGYKAKRPPTPSDIQASMQFFQELLVHSTAYQIQMPGIEADDVIATLVAHYAPMAQRVEIYSNDYDLMPLTGGNVFCGAIAKEGVKTQDIQVYKAFVGDSSDEVPGVKGFGKAAWAAADVGVLRAIALGGDLDKLLPLMFRSEARGEQSIKTWITENREQLTAMWTIVGFLPPSISEVTSAIQRPIHDPVRIEAMLRDLLL